MTRVELKLNIGLKKYEIQAPLNQVLILLEFQTEDVIGLEELERRLGIPSKSLQKNIKPLQEIGLLSMNQEQEKQAVRLNTSFESKKTKIKIFPTIQQEPLENETIKKDVEEDRKLYLQVLRVLIWQALLVRIMKAKKEIQQSSLVAQVIEESKNRFSPSVAMIKKCIEQLIEKQYLEVMSDKPDWYVYVA